MSKKDTINNKDEKEKLNEDQNQSSTKTQEEKETSTTKEEDQIVELEEKLEQEKDRFIRLFAEFENYKKRTSRERLEFFKTAGEDVMLALLPVMDDFERALNGLGKDPEDPMFIGVQLIFNKLRDTLKTKGLEAIEVKPGDVFDVDIHEAVTQIPAPDKKLKGKIVDVIERGYRLNDKIIRYPKVVTGE